MTTDLYQEYLYVIGKLKDVHGLDLDVDHRDIHTFFKDKRPLFKLLFGSFEKDGERSIVVSFHVDLPHPDVISWFIEIYKFHPLVKVYDSYMEDTAGETYLGEDALALKDLYNSQEVLSDWLDNKSEDEIEDFAKSEVQGKQPNTKLFSSKYQHDEAIMEFTRTKKPNSGETIH